METGEGFLKAGMKRSFASTAAEVAGTEQLEESHCSEQSKDTSNFLPPSSYPCNGEYSTRSSSQSRRGSATIFHINCYFYKVIHKFLARAFLS